MYSRHEHKISTSKIHFYNLDEKTKETCSKVLKHITKTKALDVKYTAVTEEERKNIVKAIGLRQGHWFKCPKGKRPLKEFFYINTDQQCNLIDSKR